MGGPTIADITPMIITFNEAPNIGRCLERLTWAKRILVIDSGSTDETLAIVARYPQAVVVTRPFDTFAGQCNFGLSKVETEWVLSLDADYILAPDARAQFESVTDQACAGFLAAFTYCIHGHPLRGTLYPPRVVLYRRALGTYRDEGHGHRLQIDGAIGRLSAKIEHDDRKSLSRWLASQQSYARREADYLLSAKTSELGRTDRIRRMAWPAPIFVFFYALVVKGCLFDGWPGWHYVLQRVSAEAIIALELIDRRLLRKTGS